MSSKLPTHAHATAREHHHRRLRREHLLSRARLPQSPLIQLCKDAVPRARKPSLECPALPQRRKRQRPLLDSLVRFLYSARLQSHRVADHHHIRPRLQAQHRPLLRCILGRNSVHLEAVRHDHSLESQAIPKQLCRHRPGARTRRLLVILPHHQRERHVPCHDRGDPGFNQRTEGNQLRLV